MPITTLDPLYMTQLADQTRPWRVAWSEDPDAVTQFLTPAIEHPREPAQWRHDTTWELVRQAVRWHQKLTDRLNAWDWPICKAWWAAHGGPRWDPYSFAVAIAGRMANHWETEFAQILHNPVKPGLAAWAYGVWRARPLLPDLVGLPPLLALDHGLRACESPDRASSWWDAWRDWISEPSPTAADPVPLGRYPTALVQQWQQTLAQADTNSVPPVHVRSVQLHWF